MTWGPNIWGSEALAEDVKKGIRRMSPFLAVSVLACFANKKSGVQLTYKAFEEAQDALVTLLEKANDEKYRLVGEGEVLDVQETK